MTLITRPATHEATWLLPLLTVQYPGGRPLGSAPPACRDPCYNSLFGDIDCLGANVSNIWICFQIEVCRLQTTSSLHVSCAYLRLRVPKGATLFQRFQTLNRSLLEE